MSLLKEFENFLSGLNLQEYREQYIKYKTVELNLAKAILPLRHIYREYWHKHSNWKDYDQFYSSYYADLKQEIEDFRDKHFFSKETFRMDLKLEFTEHGSLFLLRFKEPMFVQVFVDW